MDPRYPTFTHFIPHSGTSVSTFVGEYEHQMDEKGRVSLPSAFRREADAFVLVHLPWEGPYLTLLPEGKWAEVQERLLEYRKQGREAWNQVRFIVSRAVELNPDKQGRILIPANLQGVAGLSGSVLLNGNLDRVELWNPDTFRGSAPDGDGGQEEVWYRVWG